MIDLLGSPEVAIDDRHGPKLYARFLQCLLSTPMARIDPSPSSLRRDPAAPRRSKTTSSTASSPSHPSTPTRQSLSPAPASASTQSSPKPYTPSPTSRPTTSNSPSPRALPSQVAQTATSSHVAASSFTAPIAPPLFFDSEMIQSMQSVDVFPDVVLPG